MVDKKEQFVKDLLAYWKVPETFSEESWREKLKEKYQREDDSWKIDFQVEKRRKNHSRILHSANVIARIAEGIFSNDK